MIRMACLGSATALAFSLPAAAQNYSYSGYGYDGYGYENQGYYQSNCDRERSSNQAAGTIVGAIAGGLIGAAIADDGDGRHHRRGHHRYKRGYGYGYRGYGHGYRHNDDGDKVAGALIGGVVGAIAGNAIAGSASNDCVERVYNSPQGNARYGGMNVPAPTRQPYGQNWDNDAQPVRLNNGYGGQGEYGLRPGEELYGGGSSYNDNPAWSDPEYGATTQGYNAGYSAPRDTGECRTVYRDRYINGERVSEPATACNVGGDRWEFVE